MKNLTATIGLTITMLLGGVGVSAGENITPRVGSNIYLNACGGDPKSYKSQPLNLLDKIVEVPNIVTKMEPSEYGRPFRTEAKSSITLPNGARVNIKLVNFRNIKISDQSNKVLLSRKVTGATSIYEYRSKTGVIAWGVGWRKGCEEGYDTDFTVLRTFAPYIKNGNVKIHNKILQTNVSKFKNFYKKIDDSVFVNTTDITNGHKLGWCYYCGFEFLEISNFSGIKPLSTLAASLVDKYQIDFAAFDDLVPVLNFLSRNKNNLGFFKNFLQKNYKKLTAHFVEKYWLNSVYDRDRGTLINTYTEYYPEIIDKFNTGNMVLKDYVNPEIFKEKRSFQKYFEKTCNLENLHSFAEIANVCFPHHMFFFDIFEDGSKPPDLVTYSSSKSRGVPTQVEQGCPRGFVEDMSAGVCVPQNP